MKHFIIGSEIKHNEVSCYGKFIASYDSCVNGYVPKYFTLTANGCSLSMQYVVFSKKNELLYCGYDIEKANTAALSQPGSYVESKKCLTPDSFSVIQTGSDYFAAIPSRIDSSDDECLLFCGLSERRGFDFPYSVNNIEGHSVVLCERTTFDSSGNTTTRDVVAILKKGECVTFKYHESFGGYWCISYIWDGLSIVEKREKVK